MRPFRFLLLFLVLLSPSSPLLEQLPGLYIDTFILGSTSGSPYTSSASGYNFTRSWRQSLPKIISSGLCLYNFKVAANKMLTYQAQIVSQSSSGLIINLQPTTSDVGIMYLAFSAIVITEDNNYLQLLTFTSYSVTDSSYYITSSKFYFDSSSTPHIVYYFQWVTAYDIPVSKTYDNYWAYLYVYFVSSSSTLKISYTKDATFMKGIKMIILLTNKEYSQMYSKISANGDSISKSFSYNFGVDGNQYGLALDGTHCLSGLYVIDIYFYRSSSYSSQPNFLFTMNGSEVSDITFSLAYAIKMETACFNFGKTVEDSVTDGVVLMGTILGAVIGGTIFIMLLTCILVRCCCWRGSRSYDAEGEPHSHSHNQARIFAMPAPQDLTAQEWVKQQLADSSCQQCSICLSPQVNVLTSCGHYFHSWCLVSWSIKMDSCPNCRHQLRSTNHLLICSKCSINSLEVNFRDISQFARLEDAPKVICSSCKNVNTPEFYIF